MRRTLVLATLFLITSAQAGGNAESRFFGDAGRSAFESDFEEPGKAWQEIQAQLPPYPKAGDLFAFEVSSSTSNRYFLDFPSVSADADGVVRYTVVIRSPTGAETVSYEGMRCENGERKLYAFGRADGKGGGEWSRNRYAKWEAIKSRQQTGYHRELFFHYLCTVDGAVNLQEIRRLIKAGGQHDREH